MAHSAGRQTLLCHVELKPGFMQVASDFPSHSLPSHDPAHGTTSHLVCMLVGSASCIFRAVGCRRGRAPSKHPSSLLCHLMACWSRGFELSHWSEAVVFFFFVGGRGPRCKPIVSFFVYCVLQKEIPAYGS